MADADFEAAKAELASALDARMRPLLDDVAAIKSALQPVKDNRNQPWAYSTAFASQCDRVLAIADAVGPVSSGGTDYPFSMAFESLCDRVLALTDDVAAIKAALVKDVGK